MLIMDEYLLRTELLVASFFDIFYSKCIFYHKPHTKLFLKKSITEYYFISQRTPLARVHQTGISFYLQNLKPEKGIGRNSILYNRYSLRGVCWISKNYFMFPCYLRGHTFENKMSHTGSAVLTTMHYRMMVISSFSNCNINQSHPATFPYKSISIVIKSDHSVSCEQRPFHLPR